MELNLIFARAAGGAIGKNNTLPWHLPEDLAHFRQLTMGQPVIMGRATWDSLPARFRPLPGRTNVVLTRQTDWHGGPGVARAASLTEAIARCGDAPCAWVIGGAQIYAQALPLAQRVEVTDIDLHIEGADAFAPALPAPWQIHQESAHTAANGLRYRFITYLKK
jgi:dihydrofolate reductase